MSPHTAVVAAALAAGVPAPTPTPAPVDTDVPICLDFLKGRCTRAQCRFLHPDLAQYKQLSGAVHARAGRRVCEVWAMTGQCKFGAKCSRLHPSVVPSPQPQQALTLMLPLALVPQAMAIPVAPTPAQPPVAAPAVPQRQLPAARLVLPSAPLDMHALGPVTVRPPLPVSHPRASPPLTPPNTSNTRVPKAPLTPVPSDPRLALMKFAPPPPRPQHVALPPTAEPTLVGIQDLARSILNTVEKGTSSPLGVSSTPPGSTAVAPPAASQRRVLPIHDGADLPFARQPPAPAAPAAGLPPTLPAAHLEWERAILNALRRIGAAGC